MIQESELTKKLCDSVKENDLMKVKELINAGANPDDNYPEKIRRCERKIYPLLNAIHNFPKSCEIIEFLVQSGADLNKKVENSSKDMGESISNTKYLIQEVYDFCSVKDNYELLEYLLKLGINPNLKEEKKWRSKIDYGERKESIIQVAVKFDEINCLKALCEFGKDKIEIDNIFYMHNYSRTGKEKFYEKTALSIACEEADDLLYEHAKILIKYGANINSIYLYTSESKENYKDFYPIQQKPLHAAIQALNLKIVWLLLKCGALREGRQIGFPNSGKKFVENSSFEIKSIQPIEDLLEEVAKTDKYISTNSNTFPENLEEKISIMRELLDFKFSKANFKIYPKKIRENMVAIFMSIRFKKKNLKSDIIFHIFNFLLMMWDKELILSY